jgi:gentisate 1,2-dioxygenase
MMSAPKAHNQRSEFSARIRAANFLEYWEADYRTNKPETGVLPYLWPWEQMKHLMLQSEQVIGINEAERRGLILANPGLGGKPFMTNTLFGDVQILSPGESAPAHRHTTSASRFMFEGIGAFTTVEGEKCTMGPGDLVINPSWAWHDHGNEGDSEVTYLNILDVPLVAGLGCTFYDHEYWKEGDASPTIQSVKKHHNRSFDLYATGGIRPRMGGRTAKPYSPQLIYRYDEVRPALDRLTNYEPDPYDGYIIEYINPESGGPVMPTMSFTMQMLAPGQHTMAHRHTSSTIYCAVDGEGYTDVDGTRLEWRKNDVFVVPTWAWHEHVNKKSNEPALLFAVTDAPAIEKLSLYREEGRSANGEAVMVTQP